jgi:hypothetical protein
MNEEHFDRRTAALAAATALAVGDAEGYANALANLPPFDGHNHNDTLVDTAVFSGSGVVS